MKAMRGPLQRKWAEFLKTFYPSGKLSASAQRQLYWAFVAGAAGFGKIVSELVDAPPDAERRESLDAATEELQEAIDFIVEEAARER